MSSMAMMVKCKRCNFEHPSTIQIDKISFETTTLSNHNEQCPQCGSMSTYNKEDYFFK
jgi:Zn finger protein HypA/HybF involved in hydrogenase expression